MNEILKAPWTTEQVDQLNINQGDSSLHPYTCGNKAVYHNRLESALLATETGWACLGCGYIQDWCHAFSAKPFAVKKRFQLV